MEQEMTVTKSPGVVDVLSLQERLGQIEGSIEDAHAKLDRIQPRGIEDDKVAPEPPPGAQEAAQRCQRKLEELNQRLINVVELVGAI